MDLESARGEPRLDSLKLLSLYLYSAGRHEEACDLILSTLEKFPGDVELIENSGVLLRILKKPIDAINRLLEAHRLAPEKANVCDALAHTFFGIGDTANADRFGRLALELKDKQAASNTPVLTLPKSGPPPFREDGPKKNVISFSLWGSNPRYLRGAIRNVTAAYDIYPGWVCRFYCDDSVPQEVRSLLVRRGAEVVMRERPSSFYEGLCWRFEVVHDETVDRFLVRDCDSVVNVKERVAVDEWLASDKWFHVMRDFASHTEVILAGMWGGVSGVLPPLGELLQRFDSALAPTRTYDQLFLREIVWPVVRQSFLCHDSVYTGTLGSVPFPALGSLPRSVHIGQNEAAVRETVIVDLPEFREESEAPLVILTGVDGDSVRYVGDVLAGSPSMSLLQAGSLSRLIETLKESSKEFLGSDKSFPPSLLACQVGAMIEDARRDQPRKKGKGGFLIDDTGDFSFLTELAKATGARLLVVVRDPRDIASSRRICGEEEAVDWAGQWSSAIGDTARARQVCSDGIDLVRYEDFSVSKMNSTLRRLEEFLELERGSLPRHPEPVDVEKPLPEAIARVIEHHAAPRMQRLKYLRPEKFS